MDFREVRCDDASEGAAFGLIGVMTGISEACWCAGWLNGLEFQLWKARQGPGRFGQGEVTERQSSLLRLLAEECDGWWIYDRADNPRFIRTAEWLAILKEKGIEDGAQ